jgi:3-oxoacyl-(acyl-carrier-protein) synthase
MQAALADAGLSPADVDVVYAAANGAPGLDEVEAAALVALFGTHRPLVTSIKGAIGESGASGAAACVAALACGEAGLVPPIAGLSSPLTGAAALNLATATTAAPGPIALVNSVASGGALCTVVLHCGA